MSFDTATSEYQSRPRYGMIVLDAIPEKLPEDRRERHRFAIALPVQWTLIYRTRAIASGSGVTTNISSGGLAFSTAMTISQRREIVEKMSHATIEAEVIAEWPVQIDGMHEGQKVNTSITCYGRIVRLDNQNGDRVTMAVKVMKHEIKTRGRKQ